MQQETQKTEDGRALVIVHSDREPWIPYPGIEGLI